MIGSIPLRPFRPALLLGASLLACATAAPASADTGRIAIQTQGFQSGDPTVASAFARSVAVHGDLMVVGSSTERRAYVYERSGSEWIETAVLRSGLNVDDEYYFGVAVACEGDVIAVTGTYWGGNTRDVSVWVYERDGTDWPQVAWGRVQESDGILGTASVAISGDRIAVGAPLDFDLGDRGRVAVFERGAGDWPLACTFFSPNSNPNDLFGWSVDVDGARVLAGAPNANEAYLFDASEGCALEQLLVEGGPMPTGGGMAWSVSLDGPRAAVSIQSESGVIDGSIGIFELENGTWNWIEKVAPVGLPGDALFGTSVALQGDTLIGGATGDDPNFTAEGSVYLFAWDGASWCEELRLNPDDASAGARFGSAVGLDGGTIVVASRTGNGALDNSGVAHAFEHGSEQGTSYCVAGLNSTGMGARIEAFGDTQAAALDFHLVVSDAPPGENGLFLFGPNVAQVPFGGGFRCIGGPVHRLHPILSIDAAGHAYHRLDLSSDPALEQIVLQAPVAMNFQLWYRDGPGWNLSDGLGVLFQ